MSTTGDSTLPPGLNTGNYVSSTVEVMHDGGLGDLEWMPYEKVKLYTNAFIKQGNKVGICH